MSGGPVDDSHAGALIRVMLEGGSCRGPVTLIGGRLTA